MQRYASLIVIMLGLAMLVAASCGPAEEPASSTPLPSPSPRITLSPTPTTTPVPTVQPSPTPTPSLRLDFECSTTRKATVGPHRVLRGRDLLPTGLDLAGTARCSFARPVKSVKLSLQPHRSSAAFDAFTRTFSISPPSESVAFPLEQPVPVLPRGLEAGRYDRTLVATDVRGQTVEMASNTVWVFDPEQHPEQVVREALARRLDIAPEAAELTAYEFETWLDASLGCPEPGSAYGQVRTPGFRLVFQHEGTRYEYHTDQTGSSWVACEGGRPVVEASRAEKAARRALAERLEAGSAEALKLIEREPREWEDASLGCPEPGEAYAQVLTPGSRFVFEHEGQRYEVHAAGSGSSAVICEGEALEMIPAKNAALVALAERLGISTQEALDEVEVVTAEARQWKDRSLGCPEPGKVYAQVLTPGYRLVLGYRGTRYEYHTNADGSSVVSCEPEGSSGEGGSG